MDVRMFTRESAPLQNGTICAIAWNNSNWHVAYADQRDGLGDDCFSVIILDPLI